MLDLDNVFSYIVNAFLSVVDIMQNTCVFKVGTITVSLFNLLVAGLILDLILYIIFPWFGGDDDD